MGGLYTLWTERGNVYFPKSLASEQTEVWSTNIQVSCLQSDIKKSILSCNVHACVLSHFSHVLLCNAMDCSPPISSVHGILQARILEWVAMPSSR